MKTSKAYQATVTSKQQFSPWGLSRLGATAILLLSFALPVINAQAADRYWDIDGVTNGSGPDTTPDGTWDNSTANWSTATGGNLATTTWVDANNDIAIFSANTDASGTFTISLSGTRTAGGITFQEGTVTISGGTQITLTGTSTINVAATAASINSVIGGSAGLTKTGAGTLTLNGVNTYTGNTTITTGTLAVGDNSAISAGTLILNGGTIQASGAARTLANAVSITANSTIGGTLDLTFSGNASEDNSRTLTVNNTGVTTFSGTTLTLSPNNAIETLTINVAGTSGGVIVSSVVQNGTGTGADGMIKSGTGSLTLSGNNTFTGGLNVSGGTIVLGHNNAAGNAGTLTLGDGITVQGTGGSRTIGNNLSIGGNLTFSGSENLIFTDSFDQGAARTYTVDNTTEFSGVISGGDNLTKGGTGTLILSGANTIGLVTVNTGGALQVANNGALGTPGAGTDTDVNSGGALQLIGGRTIGNETLALDGTGVSNDGALRNISGDNSWAGAITISSTTRINSDSGTLTIDVASGNAITGTADNLLFGGAGNVTVNDTIATTTGTLTKDGDGTLVLAGANTYSGATTVSQGILRAANSTALGATGGGVSVTSGAALELQNNIAVGAEALTLNGAGIGSGGALRNVSGNNSYAGAVTLASASRINSDAGTLTLSGGVSGGFAKTFGGAGNITVTTTAISGTGGLVKDGAGTLNLNVVSTYTGGTTLNQGAITLGASTSGGNGALGANANNLTFAGGILNANNQNVSVGALTLSANSSIINLVNDATLGTLTFASATYVGGSLTIYGWQGSAGGPNTVNGDRILITAPDASFLSNIQNVQFDLGGGQIYFGMMSGNELMPSLTPVPEPIHYALGIFGLVFVGVRVGRHYRARRQTT